MLAKLPRRLALWAAAHAPLSLLDPPYPWMAMDIEIAMGPGQRMACYFGDSTLRHLTHLNLNKYTKIFQANLTGRRDSVWCIRR
jgi:hypothetical protein